MDVVSYVLAKKYADDSITNITERGQSDWNQSDPSAKDYVKNRTHYEEVIETEVVQRINYFTNYDPAIVSAIYDQRKTAKITCNGGEYQYSRDTTQGWIVANARGEISIFKTYNSLRPHKNNTSVNNMDVTYCLRESVVHPLDEKFIPNTIARIKDINEAISTDDEIIDMLIQEDMLFALTDSIGSILTDENNNILTW